jgi:hypothetical protein
MDLPRQRARLGQSLLVLGIGQFRLAPFFDRRSIGWLELAQQIVGVTCLRVFTRSLIV